MSWFRGVVQAAQDSANGVKLLRAMGRGVRELQDVPLLQQRGFVSIPLNGDVVLCLQANDLTVAVASGSTDRPQALPGETVVYATSECFIRVMPDQSVHIQASKIVFGSDEATPSPMNGVVTKSCLCAFTGAPHPDGSSVVFAEKIPS